MSRRQGVMKGQDLGAECFVLHPGWSISRAHSSVDVRWCERSFQRGWVAVLSSSIIGDKTRQKSRLLFLPKAACARENEPKLEGLGVFAKVLTYRPPHPARSLTRGSLGLHSISAPRVVLSILSVHQRSTFASGQTFPSPPTDNYLRV